MCARACARMRALVRRHMHRTNRHCAHRRMHRHRCLRARTSRGRAHPAAALCKMLSHNRHSLPGGNAANNDEKTDGFLTSEASGSISQAANMCEIMKMGADVLLVDKDVSTANFMARDGRIRALVADETITPLLYRVNGLYQTHHRMRTWYSSTTIPGSATLPSVGLPSQNFSFTFCSINDLVMLRLIIYLSCHKIYCARKEHIFL